MSRQLHGHDTAGLSRTIRVASLFVQIGLAKKIVDKQQLAKSFLKLMTEMINMFTVWSSNF